MTNFRMAYKAKINFWRLALFLSTVVPTSSRRRVVYLRPLGYYVLDIPTLDPLFQATLNLKPPPDFAQTTMATAELLNIDDIDLVGLTIRCL